MSTESKNSNLLWMVAAIVMFLTTAILAFIYYIKPTFIDKNKPAEVKPPAPRSVDPNNLVLVKSLAETSNPVEIQHILRSSQAA